jgi:hypothetical protein
MSPEVTAAIIAGCFGVLTLIGTVIAQVVGFRSTRSNTERQVHATHEVTARTLAQQRELLDTTLKAQSEQLKQTLAEQRIRTLNERFATAAGQLGSDKPPAVRLAGVYAMAGLADDWPGTGRPVLMSCARICACPMNPTQATMLPHPTGLLSKPAVRSATRLSGSLPRASNRMPRRPGKV